LTRFSTSGFFSSNPIICAPGLGVKSLFAKELYNRRDIPVSNRFFVVCGVNYTADHTHWFSIAVASVADTKLFVLDPGLTFQKL
jgi:hypothetical protein